MKVPFLDLNPIHRPLQAELESRFALLLARNHFIMGQELEAFESKFADFTGSRYSLGVGNGLDALIISLRALGIGAGDRVLVPAHTFVATALAVTAVNATPVFVDCEPETGLISKELLINASRGDEKAVIPVHLYGFSCPMDEIMDWAQQSNVKVVEDNAQAQGATWNAAPTGSWGHMNATSFYPGKNLGALGDAGAISTNDTNLYESAKVIRNYGSRVKYEHEVCGMNSRLDEIQAAFLALKLQSLPEWNLERKRIASAYDKAFNELTELKTLQVPTQSSPVYHLYVIRCKNRLALQESLSAQGIQTLIHYPIPLHKQRCFEALKLVSPPMPIAEQWAATCLSLPIYPGLTAEQQSLVINSVHSHFGSRIRVTTEDVERLRAH